MEAVERPFSAIGRESKRYERGRSRKDSPTGEEERPESH